MGPYRPQAWRGDDCARRALPGHQLRSNLALSLTQQDKRGDHMDWLTFTARALEALAWPAAAVVIAAIFHRQLKDLLSRIRRGSFGGAELEFEQEVRALARELEERSPPPAALPPSAGDQRAPPLDAAAPQVDEVVASRAGGPPSDERIEPAKRRNPLFDDVLSLSEADLSHLVELMNPRTVILNSWRSVERALRELGLGSGSSHAIVLDTSARESLPPDQYARFVGLRTLRNRVVHDLDSEPTMVAALNYAAIARDFVSQLQRATEQPT